MSHNYFPPKELPRPSQNVFVPENVENQFIFVDEQQSTINPFVPPVTPFPDIPSPNLTHSSNTLPSIPNNSFHPMEQPANIYEPVPFPSAPLPKPPSGSNSLSHGHSQTISFSHSHSHPMEQSNPFTSNPPPPAPYNNFSQTNAFSFSPSNAYSSQSPSFPLHRSQSIPQPTPLPIPENTFHPYPSDASFSLRHSQNIAQMMPHPSASMNFYEQQQNNYQASVFPSAPLPTPPAGNEYTLNRSSQHLSQSNPFPPVPTSPRINSYSTHTEQNQVQQLSLKALPSPVHDPVHEETMNQVDLLFSTKCISKVEISFAKNKKGNKYEKYYKNQQVINEEKEETKLQPAEFTKENLVTIETIDEIQPILFPFKNYAKLPKPSFNKDEIIIPNYQPDSKYNQLKKKLNQQKTDFLDADFPNSEIPVHFQFNDLSIEWKKIKSVNENAIFCDEKILFSPTDVSGSSILKNSHFISAVIALCSHKNKNLIRKVIPDTNQNAFFTSGSFSFSLFFNFHWINIIVVDLLYFLFWE